MSKSIFVKREEHRETPEVHIAGNCFKLENGQLKIMFAKRSSTRQLFPNRFEGCGGQLRNGESFTQGVVRHFLQELNVTVEPLKNIFTTYNIDLDPGIIPGVRYLCRYINGQPTLINHTELIWLTEDELKDSSSLIFVDGLKDELLQLLELYKIYQLLEDVKKLKTSRR